MLNPDGVYHGNFCYSLTGTVLRTLVRLREGVRGSDLERDDELSFIVQRLSADLIAMSQRVESPASEHVETLGAALESRILARLEHRTLAQHLEHFEAQMRVDSLRFKLELAQHLTALVQQASETIAGRVAAVRLLRRVANNWKTSRRRFTLRPGAQR